MVKSPTFAHMASYTSTLPESLLMMISISGTAGSNPQELMPKQSKRCPKGLFYDWLT